MGLDRRARLSGDQSHDDRLLHGPNRMRSKLVVDRQRHSRGVISAATDRALASLPSNVSIHWFYIAHEPH